MKNSLKPNKEVAQQEIKPEFITLGKVSKLTKGGGSLVQELFGKYGK